VPFEQVGECRVAQAAQPEEFTVAAEYLEIEGVFHAHAAARARGLAGADLGQCFVIAGQTLDQHLDASAAFLAAVKPCVHDPRVVEHQQVARHEPARQVADRAVRQRIVSDHQKAAGAAFGRRCLGDQFFGQRVIEIGQGEHGTGRQVRRSGQSR
jgi:hypothetical protein